MTNPTPGSVELCAEPDNIAETLAREMKAPQLMASPDEPSRLRHLVLPKGWTAHRLDDEALLPAPRRISARVLLSDADSFVEYVLRHAGPDSEECTIWCAANWTASALQMTAVLNDHAAGSGTAGWRDHTATYSPEMSAEWRTWTTSNRKPFSQVDFAEFIENNRKDIASVDGYPTGAQMFEMATNMEAAQDVRFKSAVRLQSGGVRLQFIADDDAQTIAQMQLFDRFAIGIPVFWGGESYRLIARLRYRVRDAKCVFWYELDRPDVAFEDAAKTVVLHVRAKTEVPFFFGSPVLK